jgi:hypothetical protein
MSMDYETNSSHYASSRTALWCPICGAKEGQGCTEVKGLRFSSHNSFAVSRPVLTPAIWEPTPARKDKPRLSLGLRGWVN